VALEPGKATALIGHSGAGKSTLARILANCIRPHVGEVRIDDANYTDWNPDELACHIGYMPQQCDLLPGTLAENISRFAVLRGEDPEAVGELVIAAAKLAGVHEMILRFPNAYDAVVGDPAFGMSGGQRQRIALARALYDSPKLLVLDEPNSALDAEGEAALIWAIKAATTKGTAALVVSHQPQIVNACDNLAIMRNGAIEHHGPKDTILELLREENVRNNVLAMKRESGANV
jgi:ATP-binding cassette subfamily C protein